MTDFNINRQHKKVYIVKNRFRYLMKSYNRILMDLANSNRLNTKHNTSLNQYFTRLKYKQMNMVFMNVEVYCIIWIARGFLKHQ